jgi:chromosome segregation ATPase
VRNKAISETGRRQLQQILDIKRQVADTDNQIHQADTEITTLVNDQDRVRKNIQSLNQVSGQQEQVQKYARQLATQENQLASLRDHASELKKQKATLESNLNTQIEKLDF